MNIEFFWKYAKHSTREQSSSVVVEVAKFDLFKEQKWRNHMKFMWKPHLWNFQDVVSSANMHIYQLFISTKAKILLNFEIYEVLW